MRRVVHAALQLRGLEFCSFRPSSRTLGPDGSFEDFRWTLLSSRQRGCTAEARSAVRSLLFPFPRGYPHFSRRGLLSSFPMRPVCIDGVDRMPEWRLGGVRVARGDGSECREEAFLHPHRRFGRGAFTAEGGVSVVFSSRRSGVRFGGRIVRYAY